MTGRGVDQVLEHSCPPNLHEWGLTSAVDYVELAERANGRIARPVDPTYVWGDALEVLERLPDVRILNLETSITTCEDADPKGINYRMHPDNAAVLTAAGIDCCVLANNHVLDWGVGGLFETLDTLDRADIAVAGAGRDLERARAPAVLDSAGGRGGVLVFALGATDSGISRAWAADAAKPGVHLLPDFSDDHIEAVARGVRELRRPGDVVVASIHWGGNWGHEVPAEHRHFAHALVDGAGVDVIHGHSSHHPKAIEVYRDRPILYGCGDFLNDYEGISGHEELRSDLVLMYLPALDSGTCELDRFDMVPFQIRNFRLNRAAGHDRVWLRDTLARECARFGHDVSLRDDVLALEWR